VSRRRAIGAEVIAGGVEFRVWAPKRKRVAVVIDDRDHPLAAEEDGYFCGVVGEARAGTRYTLRLDEERQTYPDPASRFQPEGVHGPSKVIDPSAYVWRDRGWRGVARKGRVLYELHIGTFTPERTCAAAAQHLARLSDIGINTIELMPVNEFPGQFGWSYDGVDLWAPARLYGEPDDLRRFVDEAHAHGIGVILDVVYNHFGPDGCYLKEFAEDYFTDRHENEWGEAINFDGRNAHGVRTFFAENAAYWIDEFHFDGLRIDATQSLNDRSGRHIVTEIVETARKAAGRRRVYITAENEPQDRKLVKEYGVDAMWNDDWHHSASVAATGRREAYYVDYLGRAQEFVSMARHGFLYQGQWYRWQKKRRGTPSHDIEPERLICYLQNHDQIANSQRGERLHQLTARGRLRALTALLLLQPQTPLLFQGQEFGAQSPFVYFADHKQELAELVANGRREFLSQFPSIDVKSVPLPHDRATFEQCTLDHSQRDEELERLHRELLALRREAPFAEQRSDWLEGAVLNDACFVLRWLTGGESDRLLIVNLGADYDLGVQDEPLIAPPLGFQDWEVLWSSEPAPDPRVIPAQAAIVLKPVR
jgi:maltooligosyltrehalose trehalohydrolase